MRQPLLNEEFAELSDSTMVHSFPALFTKQAGLMVFSNQGPPPEPCRPDATDRSPPGAAHRTRNGGNAETMNPTYQRLIGPSAEGGGIDDARHIKGIKQHPGEYERRLVGFFDRALLGTAATEALPED